MKTDYVKVVYKDTIYYFSTEVFDLMVSSGEPRVEPIMMRFAEYIVDSRTNSLVKCRGPLEPILDAAFITRKGVEIEQILD